MRTLIVEDIKFLGIVLQRILEPISESDWAPDGEKAIELYTKAFYRNEPYDLICLDIMLPKMDGEEVLKTIREFEDALNLPSEKRVKIIMITSLSDKRHVCSAMDCGCDSYITKPFERGTIIEQVEKVGLIDEATAESLKKAYRRKKISLPKKTSFQ